ncbi:hypothetical protein KQX54_009631 [Cotesia glomerata]|uniref:Uncharacterized protein n=1 Tax=Cotesia glomerata TaxID=32391 RepID=A0AAV7J4Z5_COTGL|nr:hypothetical protein KQX54_009631 [Cotesia glomerata]
MCGDWMLSVTTRNENGDGNGNDVSANARLRRILMTLVQKPHMAEPLPTMTWRPFQQRATGPKFGNPYAGNWDLDLIHKPSI